MDLNSPICRVCLKNSMELIELESVIEDTPALTILESFNACTQLNALVDDDLPKYLCSICNNDLRSAYEFVRKAQEADIQLRVKLKEGAFALAEDDDQFEIDQNVLDIKLEDGNEIVEVFYQEGEDYDGDEVAIHLVEVNETDSSIQIERLSNGHNDEGTENTEVAIEVDRKPQYECSQCSKVFISSDELESHLKKAHDDNKLLCNICGKTCSTRSSLSSHMLQHKGEKPFSCDQCNKKYFTKNGLQLHIPIHSGGRSSKYLCSICGKGFATKQRIDVHHLVHTGERNYDCTYCEKKFATRFRLQNHLRIHTGERPYECSTCGLKFAQTNALKCHERIHTGEKPYECKICGKRFNQNTILKTHMTLHTGKTVKCPQCDKKFSRPSCLILHQREHTGEKPYACYKCPNRYKQKSHLDRHLDTHFGIKHKCPMCGKEYSKRSSLKIHMFDHSEDKPFQCDDCLMKFTRKDKYKAHLKKAHNKIIVKNEIAEVVRVENCEESVVKHEQEIIVELESGYTVDGEIEKDGLYQIVEIQ